MKPNEVKPVLRSSLAPRLLELNPERIALALANDVRHRTNITANTKDLHLTFIISLPLLIDLFIFIVFSHFLLILYSFIIKF